MEHDEQRPVPQGRSESGDGGLSSEIGDANDSTETDEDEPRIPDRREINDGRES